MSPRRTRAAVVLAVLALSAAACTAGDAGITQVASEELDGTGDVDDTASPSSTPDATEPDVTNDTDDTSAPPGTAPAAGEIEWEPYDDGVEVGTLEVPVDHDEPDGPTFDLFLARHVAADPDQRIGSLLVNPGGPGFGGTDFAIFAEQIYDEQLTDRFDIIGWDPRGTGQSEPAVDCIEDYDRFFAEPDVTPDDEAERAESVALAEEFAEGCEANSDGAAPYVGTNATARDMDLIRRALGEDEVSYFGFSYGSELGATWATLFPDTVRAAVLDGAADPNADSTEQSIQQLTGFESTLATFLAQCSADTSCAFHNGGDAEGAFDALMASLDESPVPSEDGRPPVNRGVATNGVVQAMYSEAYWPALERALADAAAGDGAGLLALHDSYFQRQPDGSYGNELEAFQAITCADSDERLSVEEEDALAPQFTAAAPRLAPPGISGSYFCTFFRPALDPRVEITGAAAGPIVVIGTTGDPATPLDSTRRMAEALEDGRLVVVEADQHTGYNVNRCINELVNDYLIDLVAPPTGTECR
jgi:pimeloyl-ACP methyl ester carboxylesterase